MAYLLLSFNEPSGGRFRLGTLRRLLQAVFTEPLIDEFLQQGAERFGVQTAEWNQVRNGVLEPFITGSIPELITVMKNLFELNRFCAVYVESGFKQHFTPPLFADLRPCYARTVGQGQARWPRSMVHAPVDPSPETGSAHT